ncbi:MAG: type II toxin-antitoxin system RelE/ParE family toxin [Candidatus Liptonbacteria bacterium]|nr:type II toxin-antitoxin system RelE/ParE family toxin [Candidatus Liptonbacteria bacterium]
MNWNVSFTSRALKFLDANKISNEEIFELVRKALRKFRGENINIDVKKLKGEWVGFYRIRKGNLRVIAEFDFDNRSILVEVIDWRGGVYK